MSETLKSRFFRPKGVAATFGLARIVNPEWGLGRAAILQTRRSQSA
jgi:hypothetical protein